MRIREILYESLKLPFSEYKSFVFVFILILSCEIISKIFYHFHIGSFYLFLILLRSIITLILMGISLNIVEHCIFNNSLHLNIKQHLFGAIKEYIITLYYLIIPTLISVFFMIPTGLYSKLMHIHEYILKMDIDTTTLTINEISKQLPHTLHIGLQHSLQLNILIAIIFFVLFTSFSFISKILLIKYNSVKIALDIRIIIKIIRNIGFKRFMKFILLITLLLIVLVNVLVLLEMFLSDVLLSAFFESFLLFFATNAFYKLYLEYDTKVIMKAKRDTTSYYR